MLRGEAISWIYALIIHDAIDMLINDLQNKEIAELLAGKHIIAVFSTNIYLLIFRTIDYTGFLTSHGSIPKDPKFCKNYRCEKRPTCFTDYMPHFPTNMTLKELIVGPTQWVYDDCKLYLHACSL